MTVARGIGGWSLWPMLRKEFLQLRRDRFTLAMMIGIPAVQIVLFGYAIQTEVRHQPLVVVDQSATADSRALVHTMINTGNFDLAGVVGDRDAAVAAITRGDARAGLLIPPDWHRDAVRGRPAVAQLLVDASDPLASNGAIGAAGQAALIEGQRRLARSGVAPPFSLRIRPLYNPAARSAVYIVPGIVGVLLSLTMVLVASMAVVRERERGTLEQLVVTPISRTGLMLGKLVPFLIVGYVQMFVVLLLGRLLFRIPVEGSVALLSLLALPFILASLAIGLLVSTVVQTQAQAMQLGFFFLLPNILLSGFMFPIAAMPRAAQWFSALLPLTYFLEIVRGILLRGVGLSHLVLPTVVLTGFTVVLFTLATARFRKSLG